MRIRRSTRDSQPNPTRHGYEGWLSTTGPDLTLAFGDAALVETCLEAVKVAWAQGLSGLVPDFRPRDPNDWREPQFQGVCFAPLSTLGGRRAGTRELIGATREAHPDRPVPDGDTVDLGAPGIEKFYTVPPATFGRR